MAKQQKTLLDRVREALVGYDRAGLMRLAAQTGVGFDTVYRIRNGAEHDPGFSKVQKLADTLRIK